jgi:hypothetical protein
MVKLHQPWPRQAVARRIAGVREDPEVEDQILALQGDMSALRRQLRETQERLEFAERLLARPEPPRELRP